ncbi:bis(5'-nucleosyl)-tetraphosphatase PrpE [Lentibacillus sediminis]|uniref:bis(5'-nucleosyl)-tetraphosphatase PrpE n=1 Tax=Lentibacillus sediminis TaxID=1940529 RepID=UPI000C1C23C4|nr:bis(5'-nucleosyl)-tetraphosphatase PrpE [Lentibacillus sediminis]
MKIDVIGDVHGCTRELHDLFEKMGYEKQHSIYIHPDGRLPVFLGDITDRGPASLQAINLVSEMVKAKKAQYVPGNHCNKLYRYFLGNNVQIKHGLETTVAECQALPSKDRKKVKHRFLSLYEHAPLYLQLPEANVIVAHAGIKASYIGREDKKVKSFVLYGDTTGEFYPDGRPVRRDWAQEYKGSQWIVYGHTPVRKPRVVGKTINIDTGCVFGNALTSFRLPEEETISVPSEQPYVAEKFLYFD